VDNKESKNEHRPEIFSGDNRYRAWFDCGNQFCCCIKLSQKAGSEDLSLVKRQKSAFFGV